MDEVAVWNRALSAAEVATVFAGYGGTCTDYGFILRGCDVFVNACMFKAWVRGFVSRWANRSTVRSIAIACS